MEKHASTFQQIRVCVQMYTGHILMSPHAHHSQNTGSPAGFYKSLF